MNCPHATPQRFTLSRWYPGSARLFWCTTCGAITLDDPTSHAAQWRSPGSGSDEGPSEAPTSPETPAAVQAHTQLQHEPAPVPSRPENLWWKCTRCALDCWAMRPPIRQCPLLSVGFCDFVYGPHWEPPPR